MPDDLPLRLEWRTPAELADNPSNWREHPEAQTTALEAVVSEVGWAGAMLFNERTGRLIDGHARKKLPAECLVDGKVPVLIGAWSEEQERTILATLDPLAAMAEANKQALGELLAGIETESEAVRSMMEGLAAENDLDLFAEGNGEPTTESSDGSLLALVDVTINEPRHEVTAGEVWRVGPHVLVCADVLRGWKDWAPFLEGEATVFAPYPGPFVAMSTAADKVKLVMVQPEPYIAGHILDRYAEIHGEESVRRD